MPDKKFRLEKKTIERILKNGKSIRGLNISLKYGIIPSQPAGFTFVISSKTIKKAVYRNKLKRRGRAVVREFIPKLKNNISAVIFFGKSSLGMNFSGIKQEIGDLFQRAFLFK